MAKVAQREEVQRLFNDGALLIEVLPEKQFAEIHIAGAINIPLKSLTQETTSRMERQQPVIVYCYDFQ